MIRLTDEQWMIIFENMNELNEMDIIDCGDWVQIHWLEGNNEHLEEWILCYADELFEDGFKTFEDAHNRLYELEQRLLPKLLLGDEA